MGRDLIGHDEAAEPDLERLQHEWHEWQEKQRELRENGLGLHIPDQA